MKLEQELSFQMQYEKSYGLQFHYKEHELLYI